jgi:pimeloyl-ACP methyl ester carboxylesterase
MISIRSSRYLSLFCGVVLLLSLFIQPVLGVAEESTTIEVLAAKQCISHQFPVFLQPGQTDPTAKYQVTGNLCSRGNPSGKTIQVLVHGFTLSQTYWDFPYQPERYSYVDAQTKAGYATLSIDQIGVGKSDYPPANELTLENYAYVLSQIIQQLRDDDVQGYHFPKVILVGHSQGSIVSTITAAKYRQVDGVILTGMMHTFDFPSVSTLITSPVPAEQDPVFQNANFPPGYVSLLKDARQIFYNRSNIDPKIYEIDNNTKGPGANNSYDFASLLTAISLTTDIKVPVLLVMGEKDKFFCNELLSCANSSAILDRERLLYTTESKLEAYVLPNAGHNMNYELNAPDYYTAVKNWSNKHIGTN